ncbi:ABC transporter permease [Paenibacillus solisilvae]|uniref:Putative hemin transport system permease protein HrtB n=1 Tax=Paenibacillus solisilvae TaxID=2486751 RepID=A0ABW0W7G9_9BACL
MFLLSMAIRNLMNRKLQSVVIMIIIMTGIAIAQSVTLISDGLKEGMKQTSGPFGMLVGSKGSSTQLVMNTIFLSDTPLANLDYGFFEKVDNDPRVKLAVPFGLGDQYKGFRIVGTNQDFFQLKAKQSDPPFFRLESGRLFQQPYETVIGAETSRQGHMKIGDSFFARHGVVETKDEGSMHKDHPYQVVGIMAPTQTSADLGIYTPLDSYWISHHSKETGSIRGVTSILVNPDSIEHLYRLYQEINLSKEAQAVFPGKVIAGWFDMIGNAEIVLSWISYAVMGVAVLSILLSLYGSMLERRRTISILRAIGASRRQLLTIVFIETFGLIVMGLILGTAAGNGFAEGMAVFLVKKQHVSFVPVYEWKLSALWMTVIVIGFIGSAVPALAAYRTEAAKYLNPV